MSEMQNPDFSTKRFQFFSVFFPGLYGFNPNGFGNFAKSENQTRPVSDTLNFSCNYISVIFNLLSPFVVKILISKSSIFFVYYHNDFTNSPSWGGFHKPIYALLQALKFCPVLLRLKKLLKNLA